MIVRKTRLEDVNRICDIIDQAKAYLKNQGIDQWQEGYPNRDTIIEDIKTKTSYVLVDEEVIGTMRFVIDEDPDYGYIEEGNWKTSGEYGVVHRIAVADDQKGKSCAKVMIDYAIQLCKEKNIHSLRIDTHIMNTSMRRFLNKNHFEECGFVYIGGKNKRIAYEYQF